MRFTPLALSSFKPNWAPVSFTHFFEFCSEFAELYEFEIRSALWASGENKIFWQIPGI
jgi:hypothetical protein